MHIRIGLALLLALTACQPDTVVLGYRFEEGNTRIYRMTARADARWDINGRGRGSYDVSFEVTETIGSVDDRGAVVDVEMVPTSTEEEGLPSPGLERRSFSLRLGPDGEVLEVLTVDDVDVGSLDQSQLAFIGTYRPAMPQESVRLHDEWVEERQIQLGETSQELLMTGVLTGFRRAGGLRLALISFTGRSPLEWVTALPQGEARLTGEASTVGSATVDIDGGQLTEATSSTAGDFAVRLLPGDGEAPVTGTLHLDLALTVERVG